MATVLVLIACASATIALTHGGSGSETSAALDPAAVCAGGATAEAPMDFRLQDLVLSVRMGDSNGSGRYPDLFYVEEDPSHPNGGGLDSSTAKPLEVPRSGRVALLLESGGRRDSPRRCYEYGFPANLPDGVREVGRGLDDGDSAYPGVVAFYQMTLRGPVTLTLSCLKPCSPPSVTLIPSGTGPTSWPVAPPPSPVGIGA